MGTFNLLFIMFLLAILIGLGISVLVAILVYRDAANHGMNAILWTLVAVFVPSFIGVIIYLVVRSSYTSALKCYFCGSTIKSDYVCCPKCGADLRQNTSQQTTQNYNYEYQSLDQQ